MIKRENVYSDRISEINLKSLLDNYNVPTKTFQKKLFCCVVVKIAFHGLKSLSIIFKTCFQNTLKIENRGRIFFHVRPLYEWAVSNLDPERSMHRPVEVAHSSSIEGSHTTKNMASGDFALILIRLGNNKVKTKNGMQ